MRAMHFLLWPALALAASVAQAQVSVTATISGPVVPGVYGQVVIGNAPPPPVVYAQPVIAQPVVVAQPVAVQPIYLHVPPGHAKHWKEHCHEYHACNRPVYFVKSAEYEPGYHPPAHGDEHHEDHHGHHDDGDDQGEHHGHHD
jgi:hypothetical protein